MLFDETLRELLRQAKTIAIVGAKDKPGSPVDRVGRYLLSVGYSLIPIHPARSVVWGLPVYKNLALLPQSPDIVCLFRAAEYCPAHAREALALIPHPKLFWMQEGISSPEAGQLLADSAVQVVEDRCLMVEHKRLFGPSLASLAMADEAFVSPASARIAPKPEHVFDCKRCGHCCHGRGGIVVGPGDLPRLSAHFQLSDKNFLARYTEQRCGKAVLTTGADGCCVFFKENEGCTAHDARPDVCRAWPYFRGNLVDAISFGMAREDCPGISPKASHYDFAWAGFEYLRENQLLARDKTSEGRALIVREDELPAPSCAHEASASKPLMDGRQ